MIFIKIKIYKFGWIKEVKYFLEAILRRVYIV